VYPDIGHAFFNDTNPHSYNAADAADAWDRATAFLAEHVTAGSTS
jgi:carboxymethylenebutenolidase